MKSFEEIQTDNPARLQTDRHGGDEGYVSRGVIAGNYEEVPELPDAPRRLTDQEQFEHDFPLDGE